MGKQKGNKKEIGLNIRFPKHVHERLTEVGKREGRSFNASVVDAVIEYLKKRGYEMDHMEDLTDEKENIEEAQ